MRLESKIIAALTLLFLSLPALSSQLEVGDLIFRKDASLLSDLFSIAGKFQKNRFSHVGIVAKIEPVEVWHIYDRGLNALQKESLDVYTHESTDVGIYRHKNLNQKKLEIQLEKYREQIVIFDYQFLPDNNRWYCSEFVHTLLTEADVPLVHEPSVVTLKDLVAGAQEIAPEYL